MLAFAAGPSRDQGGSLPCSDPAIMLLHVQAYPTVLVALPRFGVIPSMFWLRGVHSLVHVAAQIVPPYPQHSGTRSTQLESAALCFNIR